MNQRISVATIQGPEFINLAPMDLNPLMSKGEVKVFYIGQNRNGSAIDKAAATRMSKTLRGCPIVGYWREEKQDFGDHGDQLIIDGDGAKFNCLTKPYGFVAPDARVWFQFFEDTDEFGNTVLREYLMTECYLWTGQFEEAKRALENKNPQSMELDEESLQGHWATDNNSGLSFFIINDAIFSKLCILGEDVEPCFEGANVNTPEISSTFSFDSNNIFMKDLLSKVEELKFALKNEGGLSMADINTPVVEEQQQQPENFSSEQGVEVQTPSPENQISTEEFGKKEEEKKDDAKEDPDKKEPASEEEEKKDEEKKPNNKNSLEESTEDVIQLKAQLNELQKKFSALEQENEILVKFKNQVEDEKKDALIQSFYMLSDEDKKNVVANKAQYSLEDIEKELSVICVRKKVNFNLDETQENQPAPAVTFNLDAHQVDDVPAWLKAVDDVKNRNN